MKVADVLIGSLLHPSYEEEDDALDDEDDEKDDNYFGQLDPEKSDDVVMPVMFDDLHEWLFLQGHGQKVHDYGVSLSGRMLTTECFSCL